MIAIALIVVVWFLFLMFLLKLLAWSDDGYDEEYVETSKIA